MLTEQCVYFSVIVITAYNDVIVTYQRGVVHIDDFLLKIWPAAKTWKGLEVAILLGNIVYCGYGKCFEDSKTSKLATLFDCCLYKAKVYDIRTCMKKRLILMTMISAI